MDAVKAAAEIDHSKSVAYDESLQADFDPGLIDVANTMLYMDGVVSPEMVDEYDLVPEDERDEVMGDLQGSLLTQEHLPFLSESELETLREQSDEYTLSEEQAETMFEIVSWYQNEEMQYNAGREMADEMPHVACTAVAVCAAAAAVGVAVVAGAAVAAVTKVSVEDVT
ncbi:hypothetical protein [Halorussus halobius]|uniref:hypothetical protein n=1 Tax=Halorussus halobius TaxID=1710537 RepID=UPI001092B402|nr:hypothetical protein [Halorussus halobius]